MAANEKLKKYYDTCLNEVQFEVGDGVWMVRKPLNEPFKGKLEKDHNIDPFEILQVDSKSHIVINYKGRPKTVHANKLFLC